MANRRWGAYNRITEKPKAAAQRPGTRHSVTNERTAAWPGLPGKTQSKPRNNGIRKLAQSPREEGI